MSGRVAKSSEVEKVAHRIWSAVPFLVYLSLSLFDTPKLLSFLPKLANFKAAGALLCAKIEQLNTKVLIGANLATFSGHSAGKSSRHPTHICIQCDQMGRLHTTWATFGCHWCLTFRPKTGNLGVTFDENWYTRRSYSSGQECQHVWQLSRRLAIA